MGCEIASKDTVLEEKNKFIKEYPVDAYKKK
jgi:hypothetical protein